MDILELRSLMIDACPFECSPSIRLFDDSIMLMWDYKIAGERYGRAEKIPVRAIEESKVEVIRLAIEKHARLMSEGPDCFK